LSEIFLDYNLDKNVRIIDVACGVGIVAEEVGKFGYRNIDGLDPAKGYITVVKARGIYKNAFKEFIDPDKKTSIEDNTYDVVLCCAGFFDGLIPVAGLKELARIAKSGALIIWNVATDSEFYESTNHSFIVDGLVADGVWTYAEKPKKINNLVFTDCGSALLRGYDSSGLSAHGLVYIMKKC